MFDDFKLTNSLLMLNFENLHINNENKAPKKHQTIKVSSILESKINFFIKTASTALKNKAKNLYCICLFFNREKLNRSCNVSRIK